MRVILALCETDCMCIYVCLASGLLRLLIEFLSLYVASSGKTQLIEETGQKIRSKIDSFQNSNFLISQPNPMI